MTDYKTEIIKILKTIENKQFVKIIYNLTESAYREECAIRRIEDMEKRGIFSDK